MLAAMAESGPPGFVAEAATPWGRVRIQIWPTRELHELEVRQLLLHLGTVTTELVRRRVPLRLGLEVLRTSVTGEHARTVSAELLAHREPTG